MGKNKSKQKNKAGQASSSFTASSSSRAIVLPQKPKSTDFDKHFPTLQFLARLIEPAVNMRVYGHGSWCAIHSLITHGHVTKEQYDYFQGHLNNTQITDRDIVVYFNPETTEAESSAQILLSNEEKIFNLLNGRADCTIKRIDYDAMKGIGKFYRFRFEYKGQAYDLELVNKEHQDHSLSPASVIYDAQGNRCFGNIDNHAERMRRFYSHQEINMVGLSKFKIGKTPADYQMTRDIAFALRSALFYVKAGFFVNNGTIEQFKRLSSDENLWEKVKKIFKKRYEKELRVDESFENTFKIVIAGEKYPDFRMLKRVEALNQAWKDEKQNFDTTKSILDDINKMKKTEKIEYPFSQEILSAWIPTSSSIPPEEQVEQTFCKIEVLAAAKQQGIDQRRYFEALANDKVRLAELIKDPEEDKLIDQSDSDEQGSIENKSEESSPVTEFSPTFTSTTSSLVSSEASSVSPKFKDKGKKKKNKAPEKKDDFDEIVKEAMARNAEILKKQNETKNEVIQKIFYLMISDGESLDETEMTEKGLLSVFKKNNKKLDERHYAECMRMLFKENNNLITFVNILRKNIAIVVMDMDLNEAEEVPDSFFYGTMRSFIKQVSVTGCSPVDDSFMIGDAYFNRETEHEKKSKLIREFVDLMKKSIEAVAVTDKKVDVQKLKILASFFIKFSKTVPVIKSKLHLDPLIYMKEPAKHKEEMLETKNVLESFLRQYKGRNNENLVDNYISYIKDKPASDDVKARAFMRILYELMQQNAKEYGQIIDLYIEYFRKTSCKNDCFAQRDKDIEYVKSKLREARATVSEGSVYEVIKKVATECHESTERSITRDRIMCAVFEESSQIVDSYDTLDRVMPDFLRTGLYYATEDRNEDSFKHPSLIMTTLSTYLSDNSLFPHSNNDDVQYNVFNAYLKGAFLLAERAVINCPSTEDPAPLINRMKCLYFILCETYINYYISMSNIYEAKQSLEDEKFVALHLKDFLTRTVHENKSMTMNEWRKGVSAFARQIEGEYTYFNLNRLRVVLLKTCELDRKLLAWFDLSVIEYMIETGQFDLASVVYPMTDMQMQYHNKKIYWLFTGIRENGKTHFRQEEVYVENVINSYSEAYHRIGSRFSPFMFVRNFYTGAHTTEEMKRIVDVIFTYSSILMIHDKRDDFMSIMTFCHDLIKSLESYAMHQYYLAKFKNKATPISDVNVLLEKTFVLHSVFSDSFLRLFKIYLKLPIDQIQGQLNKRLLIGDQKEKNVEHKNFILAYAIAMVSLDRWEKDYHSAIDMTCLYDGYQYIQPLVLYQGLQSGLAHHRMHPNTNESVMMLDIYGAFLSLIDPTWSPVSAEQDQLMKMIDKPSSATPWESMRQLVVQSSDNRGLIIKMVVRLARNKQNKTLDDIFSPEMIDKLMEYDPENSEVDSDMMTSLISESTKNALGDNPSVRDHQKFSWEADLMYAVYMMKLDMYVRIPDIEQSKKEKHLNIIKRLFSMWAELKQLASNTRPPISSPAATAPLLTMAPRASQLQMTPKPSSTSQAFQAKQ